ncbi:hypothetical protein EV2_013843 [Malus domestica]
MYAQELVRHCLLYFLLFPSGEAESGVERLHQCVLRRTQSNPSVHKADQSYAPRSVGENNARQVESKSNGIMDDVSLVPKK